MNAIGIDVGGTKCLGVLVDSDANILAWVRKPTPSTEGLIDTLQEIVQELGAAPTIGIGLPGLITPGGVMQAAPNLKNVVELPVATELEKRCGQKVHVENDATSATYAEWKFGAARGATDAAFVGLGTGIGAGFVAGGCLQRGAHGYAGEIGHMVVQVDGLECVCGLRGCWERYASGWALGNFAGGVAGEIVAQRAADGDAKMIEVVDVFSKWVAIGLANLANIIDPEVIVIGGGVIESSAVFMPVVQKWFGRLLYSAQSRTHPRLESAQLGERAGAIGAALLGASM
ncbi:MAG: ROK family protein [Ilumatobacteraceae bacterium]|nr:ROK family protein [Ilumatobacteraceae bacterium]